MGAILMHFYSPSERTMGWYGPRLTIQYEFRGSLSNLPSSLMSKLAIMTWTWTGRRLFGVGTM